MQVSRRDFLRVTAGAGAGTAIGGLVGLGATLAPAHVILDLQIYGLLAQIYSRLGETDLAKKYIELTRETPPPVRKEN